jgi:hypothetical protein
LYRATRLPLFQNRIFHSRDAARNCATGDVELVQSSETGLIFNQAFRPELLTYDADYHNEQGLSSAFQSHLRGIMALVLKHFDGSTLIEVGCGKGRFLEALQAQGFHVIGMDPAYDGENPAIVKQYFTPEAGLHGDGIILRHVLEHIQEPIAFLSRLRDANGGKGKIYIEVPCFDWICRHRVWFDIFYEHVNYFRLLDFYRMFGKIYEAGHTFNGQYLFAVADLASLRTPTFGEADRFEFPEDFLKGVGRYAARLNARNGVPVAIWGAASKGVIFTLLMQRAGAQIDVVVDINPAKQGMFLPVTGIRVESPEIAMKSLPEQTEILVMNGNYVDEVKAFTQNRFSYTAVDYENI